MVNWTRTSRSSSRLGGGVAFASIKSSFNRLCQLNGPLAGDRSEPAVKFRLPTEAQANLPGRLRVDLENVANFQM